MPSSDDLRREEDIAIRPSPDPEIVDQDPGEAQKRNQGDEKDDPLAA